MAIKIKDEEGRPRVTRIGSLLPGSPPLYIVKGAGPNDFYVNGEKLIMKNLAGNAKNRRPQTLHILEEALIPLVPKDAGDSMKFIGLTAGKLLSNPNDYDLGDAGVGLVFIQKLARLFRF